MRYKVIIETFMDINPNLYPEEEFDTMQDMIEYEKERIHTDPMEFFTYNNDEDLTVTIEPIN